MTTKFGIAANAFLRAFDFEEGDGGAFVVTSWVEVFALPPMNRASVEIGGLKALVAQKFEQELLLFSLRRTCRIHQKPVQFDF